MKLVYNYNITTSLTVTLTSDFCYLNAHRYALFGEILAEYNAYWHQGKIPDYQFNAKELDEENGMYYFNARYYALPTFISRDPLFEKYPWMSPYAYCSNNPVKYIDPDGREPVKAQAGTVQGFVKFMNSLSTGIGTTTGAAANAAMLRMGETKFSTRILEPANTAPFNTAGGNRYIYTEEGGWIDMSHFMFYAGKAYQYKQDGEKYPMGKALKDGLYQEISDMIFAKHSAFSYEDLPSDKFGADFGANYFDANNKKTFGEQIQDYMNNVLKATTPEKAPNYTTMPKNDSKNPPTRTNGSTTPVYTNDNP
jgi:RHS repeat-associated protein